MVFVKVCPKCGVEKLSSCFNKCASKKDGLTSNCKECRKRHREDIKEQISEYQKRHRADNRAEIAKKRKDKYESNKEAYSKSAREYRNKNHSKILESKKKYRQDNKDKILDYMKRYTKTESGKAVKRNVEYKRRAAKRNTLANAKSTDIKLLLDRSKSCYWCGEKLKKDNAHIDHYIPLSRGGTHTIENLVVSCKRCNFSKNAKMPHEFAKSIGKLL